MASGKDMARDNGTATAGTGRCNYVNNNSNRNITGATEGTEGFLSNFLCALCGSCKTSPNFFEATLLVPRVRGG
jgi:hypothetical protein